MVWSLLSSRIGNKLVCVEKIKMLSSNPDRSPSFFNYRQLRSTLK
jgi:hypothetical protein